MDEVERKRLLEVQDLLSSVNLKILEMLKSESRETFMTEEIIAKNVSGEDSGVLKNVKIILETEKAFIVNLIGTNLTAVVAKSHLAVKYSKDDVRKDLVFKDERKWALDKLKWEEKEQ